MVMSHPPVTFEDRWVDTPRGRLAVRSWRPAEGGRAPLVLFHDSLGCIDLWRTFPAALAERAGRTVIAYDRLGFGRSDPDPEPLGLDFIEEEARTFFPLVRQQLGLERFAAFGHSVGGAMAAHCAARSGPACLALVTESAQCFVEDRTRAGIQEAEVQFRQPETFGRLRRYHGERSRWVLEAWIRTWLAPAFADWSLEPVLGQVRCPALVLHGLDDEYGSPEHPERIARALGGPVERVVLPGVRHVPHREREAEIVRRVAGFLEALDQGARSDQGENSTGSTRPG
jgi:pimeloyl-ACP methyl ester carboxylesterase